MLPTISCPSCSRSLGRVHSDGIFHAECGICRKRFGVVFGKLSHWASQREELFYLGPKWPSLYRRRYEFRITTPARDLKVLRFAIGGRTDRVPVRPGDRISVFFVPSGDRLRQLVSIQNHTIGKHYSLPSLVPSPGHLLATQGAWAVVAALGAMFTGFGSLWIWGLGGLAIAAYSRIVNTAQLLTPELRPHVSAEARLLGERSLLEQKYQLNHRMEAVRQESYGHQDLIQRLQSLRGKMLNVNASLYAGRVSRIESAIRLLKQRIHHDRLLIDQYAETIKMIDIELETAYLSDHLPHLDDFTGAIHHRLAELQQVEEQARDLKLKIEANEEIQQYGFSWS